MDRRHDGASRRASLGRLRDWAHPGVEGVSDDDGGVGDPRMTAAIEMIGRTGATAFQLRYHDDEKPVVWMCVGEWRREGGSVWEAAGAMTPLQAVICLLEKVCDGGTALICWFQYDPENQTFRRGCEGDTPA